MSWRDEPTTQFAKFLWIVFLAIPLILTFICSGLGALFCLTLLSSNPNEALLGLAILIPIAVASGKALDPNFLSPRRYHEDP